MEIWDLYTENRQLSGQRLVRGEAIPQGLYHMVVHVWITNGRGEFLISRRSANRPTYPLMWECVGGSVIAGEDSLRGALREAKEEVGIDLCPDKGRVIFSHIRGTIDGQYFGDIMDVWLFTHEGEVHLEDATTDEVCELQWLTREQIKELFDKGEFVPTLFYFFEREELWNAL